MDPSTLIDPAPTPVPAPLWFVEFFKVLGFALHAVPMNLWYAGVVVAMILYLARSEHGRRFSGRLMAQMPVILAYGINLGVVPLLFVQVAYAKVFYPATILMAWFWLAIVALLIPAYYGVYFYSSALRKGGPPMTRLRRAAGWSAALMLIAVGFLFANGWSLMTNIAAWPDIWRANGSAGAVYGTGLNVDDHTFLPRWLMMFGLALTTTAAWVAVDAAWFARRERPEYRRWAQRFAWKLYTAGVIWFALCGSWYVAHWPADLRTAMLQWPLVLLTAATAVAPGLPFLLLLVFGRKADGEPSRLIATLVGLAQFGVLGINAVSRQIVQNFEIGRYFQVLDQATDVQWSPLVLFLVVFALGLGVVAWMLAQVVKAERQTS
jgi:hypothetical protein